MPLRQFKRFDSEARVHERIAQYVRVNYPMTLFHSDFGAGIKLPIYLAARQRKLQYGPGFPDFLLLTARRRWHGLALEIKRADTRLLKRDGSWASEHLERQAAMLKLFVRSGYCGFMAAGYDTAVALIDWYMGADVTFKAMAGFLITSFERHDDIKAEEF